MFRNSVPQPVNSDHECILHLAAHGFARHNKEGQADERFSRQPGLGVYVTSGRPLHDRFWQSTSSGNQVSLISELINSGTEKGRKSFPSVIDPYV